ncbi:hypothetical protein ACPCXA_25320, partial [Lysinibacillus agricola]
MSKSQYLTSSHQVLDISKNHHSQELLLVNDILSLNVTPLKQYFAKLIIKMHMKHNNSPETC